MYDENNYDLMYCDDNAIYTVSVVSSIFNFGLSWIVKGIFDQNQECYMME